MSTPKLEHDVDALDWEGIRCQCGNHGTQGCRDHATVQVEVHAVDKCQSPGLNADGNAVALLCTRCLGDLRARVRIAVEAFNAVGRVRCRTCSYPMTHPDHVLRKVGPLL